MQWHHKSYSTTSQTSRLLPLSSIGTLALSSDGRIKPDGLPFLKLGHQRLYHLPTIREWLLSRAET